MSDINEPYSEDDEYDEYSDYDKYKQNYSKHFFKFDQQAWDAWGKWLYDAMKDIVESSPNVWYTASNVQGFPVQKFPVNDSMSNSTANSKTLYYGQNHYDEAIWKYKYFVKKELDIMYTNHIIANAKHTVSQPNYYRNMFEILN